MKITENKLNSLLVVTFFAMFFTTGMGYSQNNTQNDQQIDKLQRFIELDLDNDGYITKSEFQSSSFDTYDNDQNGKLSRSEYREMKQSINQAQCNYNGNSSTQSNRDAKGKRNCPYGNQNGKWKNCGKQKTKGIGK